MPCMVKGSLFAFCPFLRGWEEEGVNKRVWRNDLLCWLCLNHLPVGFMWITQPFQNVDSGFTKSLYFRWSLKFTFLIRYSFHSECFRLWKLLTWFLASISQYYCQAHGMQFVGPCCCLIPFPCPQIVKVVQGDGASLAPGVTIARAGQQFPQ